MKKYIVHLWNSLFDRSPKTSAPNTAADPSNVSPLILGVTIGTEARTSMILGQESAGQKAFAESTTLPVEMSEADRKALEKAGVDFRGSVPNDPLFIYVVLPAGWKKQPTDHSMWSDLIDEKGRKRAAIFYKAAYYDRNAHMYCVRRFSTQFDYDRRDEEQLAVSHVRDLDQVIYTTAPIEVTKDNKYSVSDEANALAKKWLNNSYPDWEDASAYWGELDIFPHGDMQ